MKSRRYCISPVVTVKLVGWFNPHINAGGQCSERYIPDSAWQTVRAESQIIIVVYVVVISCLVVSGQFHALGSWLAALVVGQPFLRLYLMAEHGRYPFVDNMFRNTRTTLTNRLVRQLTWNMPFHAEHHAYPNIPFYNLPQFHQLVKHRLMVTSDGYSEFHRQVIQAIKH